MNGEKEFGERMEKWLGWKKVVEGVVENGERGGGFVNGICGILDDLKKNEKCKGSNE